MKVSETLFLVGVVLLAIGAGTALFPLMGLGALVFAVGLIARFIIRPPKGDEDKNAE